MKLSVADGRVEIRAEDLAPLLEMAPDDLRRQMAHGNVTTTYELGQGDDAGRFRVTFLSDRLRVRLTCAADGTVLKRLRNTR
ncbi:MAG: DUF6522 family protein [Tranquillimonas sp.]